MLTMPAPPKIEPMILSHLALPVTTVMPNGVALHCLQGEEKGIVRLDLLFRGGYAVQEKPLQALFTNRMLREGSASLTGAAISQKLDYYGAWIDMYSSQECNHIILYVLARHLASLLPVVEEFVKNPTFPQENLAVVSANNKAHFLINSQKVDVVAQRHFEHRLWGASHTLGHIVEATDYDNITRDDLVAYYNKVYSSRNCTIFLTGSCGQEIKDAVAASFGNAEWGTAQALTTDVAPPATRQGKHRVVLPDTLQSAVKIGSFTLPASNPDIHDLRILNVLFGGYFGGRLMSNIREDKGYTYDIISEIDAYGSRNAFMISSQTATEYVEPLLKEVYREMERLRNDDIPAAEVELVRNYIMGELCREYEGLIAKAEVFVNAWLSGESFASVNAYIDAVARVTPERLQEVARKYLRSDEMFEVVVGA